MKKLAQIAFIVGVLAILATGFQTKFAHVRPLAGGKTGDVIVVTG